MRVRVGWRRSRARAGGGVSKALAWGLPSAAALAAGAWAYRRYRGRLGSAAKLLLLGGERRLREELRPIDPSRPRVLLFALDGVGQDEFVKAMQDAPEGHLARLLGPWRGDGQGFGRGFAVPEVLSILPSTTVAAWSSVFTGAPPAFTGVSGNEWFAREENRFYAPAPVSVASRQHALEALTAGLVGNALHVPTVFERADVRAHVSLGHVHRGADLLTTPDPGTVADLLEAFAHGMVDDDVDVDRAVYQQVDENAAESAIEAMDRHGIPQLQVVYFPGIDLFTHVAEDPLSQQRRYLAHVLDPLVGRVLGRYARANVLANTWVLFVADHGHTPVLHDERHALSVEGHDLASELLARLGFRVRPRQLEVPPDADHQAVVAYQGALAYLYLADRSSTSPGRPSDWRRPPRFDQDVIPVARAFFEASARGVGVPGLRGALDLVLARRPRPVGEPTAAFEVFDGEALVPVRRYLESHPRPDLLRLAERLDGLGEGPMGARAGDVLLMTRTGLECPIDRRFYFANRYQSWHGSAKAQDSRVPLVVARPGKDARAVQAVVEEVVGTSPSLLDVTPLVLHLLGRGRA